MGDAVLGKIEGSLETARITTTAEVEGMFRWLIDQMEKEAAQLPAAEALEQFRIRWLGRNGIVSRISDNWLKAAPAGLKSAIGRSFNQLKGRTQAAYDAAKQALEALAASGISPAERVDITLPGVAPSLGVKHIVRQTLEEMEEIFLSMGYQVAEGPEMETPYYNFEALNIPEHHPARDVMDTFYLDWPGLAPGSFLLRTHTSPVQVRWMEKHSPPVRIIVPGKVYRHDNPDSTHSFMFHQVEGLAVDTGLTFCDFKGTIEYFVQSFFGPAVKTRFRPSYFPFTEPSAEVDGSCIFCQGQGCRICKFSGWIELFGAGMVDPAVYGFVNYDGAALNGFAFGIGVERFAMLKYGINDIQLFFQNDVRLLRQFR